ncbi:MAG: DNA/RNA nuclease SfsA [Alphaproteobacteria bacterium]|nr:DNA/RNA nuclease SfsA [Alphaproteobacteria bacterium]
MKFPKPLIEGVLVKRYKRFLADVRLKNGAVVVAHCANSGSMLSVDEPGARVWLSEAANPERKLRYTWEMIRVGKTLVGINTQHPNRLVADAIQSGAIGELAGYESLRREVRYGKDSRIDMLLEGPKRPPCWVEVKNVTMKRDPSPAAPAEFPDAVTARGAKHLAELSRVAKKGQRAVMVFLVQRGDANAFAPAADIDPAYARALAAAAGNGVEILCYGCRLNSREIKVTKPLAIRPPTIRL